MYLYFYPPDSLTHRKLSVTHKNKMLNWKVFGSNASRSNTSNLPLAAELNFNSRNFSCASSKMLPISYCNMFLASHLYENFI